jgi:tetratricopeptide (TPR) repeat protein
MWSEAEGHMKLVSIAILFLAGAQALSAQLAKALELNDRGNRAAEQGRDEEAIGLYRDSLEIWRASGPDYDAHRAGTLMNLGIVISATGNRTEAARVLEEALALHRKVLGPNSHRTLSNINMLVSNYLMVGRVDQADALLHEALPILRESFPKDIQLARTLEGICNVLVRRDRPDEALPYAEEALRVAIAVAGEDSLDSALAYANVAEVHRAAGRGDRSLPLFRKARLLYEKGVGPSHPRVAALLSQEGLILLDEGKVSMAEELMTRAVTMLNESCPKCSVETAIAENNLALVRWQQKRYQEAGQLLSHVLALRERFTQTPGPEMASTLRLLAAVRQKEKRFEDAAQLTKRADMIATFR